MNVSLKICRHNEYLPISETETDKHSETGLYYATPMIDDKPYTVFVRVEDDGNKWVPVATMLNGKGYFVRHCKHDGVDALEVCKPDADVFCHDIAMEIRNPDLVCTQVMHQAHWYVRVAERQKARW